MGEARKINVWLPAGYAKADPTHRYSVLYLLDGGIDQDFVHIAGLARHGESSWTFDAFIVVGIATKRRTWNSRRPLRTSDILPISAPMANPQNMRVAEARIVCAASLRRKWSRL